MINKEAIFKLAYTFGLHKFFNLFWSDKGIVVLCFHRINPVNDRLFPRLDPVVFRQLLRLLRKDFQVLSFAELLERPANKGFKKPVLVISFDDGYRDFIEYALPILASEKIPVNQNVIIECANSGILPWTQRINNLLTSLSTTGQHVEIEYHDFIFRPEHQLTLLQVKRDLFKTLFSKPYQFVMGFIETAENKYSFQQPADEMMNWQEIVSSDHAGVEIGSHTYFHSSLQYPYDKNFLVKEIVDSKTEIEARLGHAIHSIAFPNGLVTPEAYQVAIGAGYKNLLLIEGVDYSGVNLKIPGIRNYKRRLVGGHTTVFENVFNASGFHKAFHF